MVIKTPNGNLSQESLKPIIKAALANNFGIALHSLPEDDNVYLTYGPTQFHNLSTLPNREAFLIAPFTFQNELLVIEPTEVFTMEEEVGEDELKWHFRQAQDEGFSKEGFKKLVRYGIEQIKAGSFDKVVAANKKVTERPTDFHPLSYFFQVKQTYPHAFTSLVSTPQYGTWVGASPELLLSFNESEIQTAALAGTQSSDEENGFTEKEEQEQALVSKYIEQTFENLALDYQKSSPETKNAGNLAHINTYYKGHVNGSQDELWKTFLQKLHPTPAVCGYPFKVSKIFIRNEEPFDRDLFTGFLGFYNPHGQSNLFVNLRCMEIHPNQVSIYAGAGIVKGSKSEEEWAETAEKMKTLEAVF
jgi:isochorismate synthase